MKLKNIKFENIFFIVALIYGVVCIMHHSQNELLYIEIPVYFGQALLVKYAVKYVRLNLKQFLTEISNLFFE